LIGTFPDVHRHFTAIHRHSYLVRVSDITRLQKLFISVNTPFTRGFWAKIPVYESCAAGAILGDFGKFFGFSGLFLHKYAVYKGFFDLKFSFTVTISCKRVPSDTRMLRAVQTRKAMHGDGEEAAEGEEAGGGLTAFRRAEKKCAPPPATARPASRAASPTACPTARRVPQPFSKTRRAPIRQASPGARAACSPPLPPRMVPGTSSTRMRAFA